MSDWADQCHAQGGTVILPHLPNPNGEPAAMIATGRVDAVEFFRHGGDCPWWRGMYNHLEYYRYLNGGYRLPLVGGTDKMSSEVPVGLYRTYVYIPPEQDFTYETWCANLAAGRTFMSGGPIISLSVDATRSGTRSASVEMAGRSRWRHWQSRSSRSTLSRSSSRGAWSPRRRIARARAGWS